MRKNRRTRKIVNLSPFLIGLSLIICLLNISPLIIKEAKAETISKGLIARVGFEPIEPLLLVLGDGTRVWITTFGNYTMKKDYANRMSFEYRDEAKLIMDSLFWVNSTYGGKPLSLSKLFKADITVLVANDTVFKFKHPLESDSAAIVGYLTVTYSFSKDVKPKISIVFENILLTEWQITWCLLPSLTYLKTTETHAEMLSATETVSFGAKTSVELGDDAAPQNWRLWSSTTWEDYGAAVVYGGLEKVLGGKGITVVFPINETVVDPSQVAFVYYSGNSPSQRRNFWANGYYRQFYVDETTYNFEYKGSSDGVTWNNLTTIAGAVANEFVFSEGASVWLENDTFVHLVFVDRNDTDNNYTLSYQTAILGTGSISLNTRRTAANNLTISKRPTVCLNSSGYPWVGYSLGNGFYIHNASAKDGSSWGSTTKLFSSQYSGAGVIVPLANGKMYVCWNTFWTQYEGYIGALGRLFNGTGWENSKDIAPLPSSGNNERFSVVVKSNFDIVYYNDQSNSYAATKNGTHAYTYNYTSDSWSYTKWVSTGGIVGSVTINKATNDMWFFHTHTNTGSYILGDGLYYNKYTNATSTWGTEVTVNSTITSICDMHGFYEQISGNLGIAYVSSNYLYFISVETLSPLAITFANTTAVRVGVGSTFNVNGTVLYNGTTTPPAAGLATIYVLSGGNIKGQTSSYNTTSGNFNFSATAQTNIGNWTYTVYAVNLVGSSVENKTLNVVTDRLVILLNTNTTSPLTGNAVNMNATATYNFDGTNVTTLGVNIARNGTSYSNSTTWTDTEVTGTIYNFTVIAANDTTYSLTSFSSNTLTIAWNIEVIEVSAIYQNSSRTGIGQTVTFSHKVVFGQNGSDVTSGSLTINGTTYTISNGWCNFTTTYSSVELVTYVASGSSFNGTVFSQIPANPQVIFDAINVTSTVVDMDSDTVYARVIYAYDGISIENCSLTMGNFTADTNSTGWASFDLGGQSSFAYSQSIIGTFEPTYSLTYSYGNFSYYCINSIAVFRIRAQSDITGAVYDGVEDRLVFTAEGRILLFTGYHGGPLSILDDGIVLSEYTFDGVTNILDMTTGSIVQLDWKTPQTGATGSSGYNVKSITPPALVSTLVGIIPTESIYNALRLIFGAIAVVVVYGAYTQTMKRRKK